jgi:hypothetical protein
MLFFSLGVAPVAFGTLPDRHLAGMVVNGSIARLHTLGYAAGAIVLVSLLVRRRGWLRAGIAATMLTLVLVSGFAITPPMAELRTRLGAIDALPAQSPDRQRFDFLHQMSVGLMGTNMLLGALLIVLESRRNDANPPV